MELRMKMIFFFVSFILTVSNLSANEIVKKTMEDALKEKALDKVAQSVSIPEEISFLRSKFFISYGVGEHQFDVTTVVPGYEVEYDRAQMQRLTVLKAMEDYFFGLGINYDDATKDISSLIGHFGGKNWYIVLERAKLSGRIKGYDAYSQYKTVATFDKNDYLDIKFLKYVNKRKNPNDPKPIPGFGIQYLKYERPSITKQDLVTYYDPKAQVTFLGIVLEADSVKRRMMEKIKGKSHDWYFYNTTSWGIGSIKFSDETKNASGEKVKPKDSTYTAPGLNGEYELGYVYSFNKGDFMGAFKIGYGAQLEAPAWGFEDKKTGDTPPTETLFHHGPQITFVGAM